MTNIVKSLSLTVGLLGLSITCYAADCNHLIALGNQKSVIPAAKNISINDVNNCMAQCTNDSCSNALSVLSYAVNYNNALSGLSPQQFTNAPSSPGLNSALPTNQPVSSPAPSVAPAATPATPTNSYIMTPPKESNKKQQTKNTGIRWY